MPNAIFTLTRDDLTPAVRKMESLGKNPTPVLRAMGTTFQSITMGTFNGGTEYRPKPWAPKKDGSPSNLQKSGLLSRSFFLKVTDKEAKLSNPTPYAARHQFGDKDGGPMPARPYYPVVDGKLTASASEKIAAAGIRQAEREIRK